MASGHLFAQFIVLPGTTTSGAPPNLPTATHYTIGTLIYLPDETSAPSLKIVVQAADGTKLFKTITIS